MRGSNALLGQLVKMRRVEALAPFLGWPSVSLCIIGVARIHSVLRRERGWRRCQDSAGTFHEELRVSF